MSNIVIAACDRKMGIGKDGGIPWKSDLKFFKEMTTNHVIIMGRKTWESLHQPPLPNRINIVVSTRYPDGRFYKLINEDKRIFYSVKDLEEALSLSNRNWPDKERFIIGGEQLYRTAFESGLVNSVLLTRYGLEDECDTFFPKSIKELETEFKKWKTVTTDNTGDIPLMRTFYTKDI